MTRNLSLTEVDFWIDKPTAMGWRGWSLLLPAIASGIGFFCFGVLGLSFTELQVLPGWFRTTLVVGGSFSLLAGTELGTVANVVEIYRKGEHLGKWDRFSLSVSLLSTVSAFVLSFAALLGANASWSKTVQVYGPILLGVLAGLDSYGGFMEFGLYLNSFDQRMATWQAQFTDFKRRMLAEHWQREQAERDRLRAQAQSLEVATSEESHVALPRSIESTRSTKAVQTAASKAERLNQMLAIYRQDATASTRQVAAQLHVSKSTVSNYLTELAAQGRIRHNGQGVQVLDGGN